MHQYSSQLPLLWDYLGGSLSFSPLARLPGQPLLEQEIEKLRFSSTEAAIAATAASSSSTGLILLADPGVLVLPLLERLDCGVVSIAVGGEAASWYSIKSGVGAPGFIRDSRAGECSFLFFV